jgi:hypothetical protein
MRTARSRTSGENLFDFFMAPFSQMLEPPQNPGRFKVRQTLELVCENGTVFIWGAKIERFSQMLKMFPRQCLFLFRQVPTLTGYAYSLNPLLAWNGQGTLGCECRW